MPPKLSPIWEYFEEDKSDDTKVLCKVGGCKVKVSRGKTGTSKAKLSNAPMMQHLKLHHPKQNLELMKKKDAKNVRFGAPLSLTYHPQNPPSTSGSRRS